MELLKDLYRIHSESGRETPMREFIIAYAKKLGLSAEIDGNGNVFIKKGESLSYPCVVAHMDQVQHLHSADFKVLQADDILIGYSKKNRRQEGLGADDKNGIWVALKCLEKYDVMKVAFFVGEEIGCVGSSRADLEYFRDCRFVLQVDRRNSGDLINEISGVELCSQKFLQDCGMEKFGYSACKGLMTDVLELRENGLEVSCVNMSCGYYNPHTDEEFTSISDLKNCLAFVENIIENCVDVYPAKKVQSRYAGYGWGRYGHIGYYTGYAGFGGFEEKEEEEEDLGDPWIPKRNEYYNVEDAVYDCAFQNEGKFDGKTVWAYFREEFNGMISKKRFFEIWEEVQLDWDEDLPEATDVTPVVCNNNLSLS